MNKLKHIFLLVLMLAVRQIYAQEKDVPLTMEEAIKMGIDNSKKLKIAQEEIAKEGARLGEARQKLYPDVSLSGTYLKLNSPNVDAKFAQSSEDGSSDGGSGFSPGNISQVALGQVSVSQPIFAGLRIRHNVNAAKYNGKAATLDAEDLKEQVAREVIQDYFDLYKLYQTERFVKENLNLAKERVRNFINLEKNGVVSHNDLLRAQLQQSRLELTLLDIQGQIKTANYSVDVKLGLDESSLIEVDTAIAQAPAAVEDLDYYVQTAMENRSDLKASVFRKQAVEEQLKAAKGGYYPSLALTGGYINAYVPDFITINNAANIGLGLKYSISGIFDTHHKVKEATALHNEATLRNDILKDDIKTEIYSLLSDYETNLKKIETVKVAVNQANENLSMRKNSYNNGLILLDDMLEAEVQLLQNKVDLSSAKADAMVSYYNLLLSTGTLSESLTN